MTSPCTTSEKHNLNCVLKASLELINLPLIDILANHVKEVDLFNRINSCSTLVSGKYRLRTDQLKICHVQPPAIPDYSQFDVTLLYTLIRNLCPSLKPTQGWGKEPKTTDTQLGDDIERLRLFRNNWCAHVVSKGIPNAEFKILWKNLKSVINRIQSNGQTVCSVNYEEELIAIENFKFTQDHLENCKLLLQALVNLQTDERDEPVVVIEGKDEVICGDLAQLEAVLKPDSSCWSITWQKRRGNVIQSIDKSKKKYSGSTNRKLVIQSVCKEDEGEYQVLLSHESNGNEYLKCRHTICLRVFGDLPLLNDLEVTTKDEGIIIHYNYEVPSESPEVQCIEWSKDGQLLNTNTCKFVGGRISDSSLTIMLPTEDDKGTYSCKITNAVGFVSKDVLLDVPSVDIELNRTVCFGSKATITAVVVSTPQPEKVIWQKSRDGKKFHGIDITKPNYYGSSDIPFKPMLVIPRATFDDKQFYRLLVRNKIKESISDTVYLNVTGSPPNLSTSHVTNTRHRILKLIGNVSLYDGSPDIQELFWTKNGKKIDTKGSGGRLSEVSNDDISLTIRNVNTEDAGVYQCTAINAVGSTASDVIILGVPEVVFEKPENKEDNSQSHRVTIQSVPSPSFVQWSSKGIGKEIFTPIDVNDEDYKGTLNTLPHPVLVVKKNKLENYDYQIEVANFIGCTVKQISDNEHHPTETKTKENKIYKDRDAGIKFAKLSNYLAKNFPDGELGRLRLMLLASDKVENVSAILSAKSAYDCFTILLKENLFTQNDVILMQFLCKETGCDDLYSECIKYALTNKALCYFEKPPDNGYKNIQFHIQGDLSDYTKEQIKHIVEVVADILDCGTQDIFVNGVKHSNSFCLVLSIKEAFIWKLSEMNEQERFRLRKLHIDFYIIDLNTVFLQSSEDLSDADFMVPSNMAEYQGVKPRFSETFGENIKVTHDAAKNPVKAQWKFSNSCGLAFSGFSLFDNRSYEVIFSGSGHARIGFTQTDPDHILDIQKAVRNNQILFLSDVRYHKRQCVVDIIKRVGVNGSRFETQYKHFSPQIKEVRPSYDVWAVIYLKFGEITAEIKDKENRTTLKFHRKSGRNVNVTDLNISLTSPAPFAYACVENAIDVGQGIKVRVKHELKKDGKPPNSFYLGVGLTNKKPKSSSLLNFTPSLYTKIEKDECLGDLFVCISQRGIFHVYKGDSSIQTQALTLDVNPKLPVYVCFEIFRIHIELMKTSYCDHSKFPRVDLKPDENCYPDPVDPSYESVDKTFGMIDEGIRSRKITPEVQKKFSDYLTEYVKHISIDRLKSDYLTPISRDPTKGMEKPKYSINDILKRLESIENTIKDQYLERQQDYQTILEAIKVNRDKIIAERKLESGVLTIHLQNTCADFIANVDAFPLCDHLLQIGIFHQIQFESILDEYKQSRQDANRSLFKILVKKEYTPEQLRSVWKAFNVTKQDSLLPKLGPS